MVFVRKGYLARPTMGAASNRGRYATHPYRNWWLIKARADSELHIGSGGYVDLRMVTLPQKYIGKRVRFKIEVVED